MCAIDAEAIVLELQHKDVISDSVQREVCTSRNQREKNALLFAHLKQTSTKESMIALCETIIDVKGNPRMKAFGEQMLQMLKGQCVYGVVCLYVFVHTYIYLCLCFIVYWHSGHHTTII